MAEQYLALIGDMVGSRALPDRQAVQRRFKAACADLNHKYRERGLLSPLTITLGDEFQALFDDAGAVWNCVLDLECALHPVTLRFSLGLGEITTPINTRAALEMDGPAFHAARDGVQRLKKSKLRYTVQGLAENAALVNFSLHLLSHERAKWQHNRLLILAQLLEGHAVTDMKCRMSISEQAIYRNIRDGALDAVRGLLGEIALLANRQMGERDAP